MTVKLTDAQLVMLNTAARREDLCLTSPEKTKGAALTKAGDKLVKLGLVREVRAKAGTPVWRRDGAGHGYAFKLTAAGLKVIAVDDGSEDAVAPGEALQFRSGRDKASGSATPDPANAPEPAIIGEHAKSLTPRAGSKLAWVVDLLQQSGGATIPNLIEATGWLPHTTRAALTGLPKRGYAIVRERIAGEESIYRISAPVTDEGDRAVVDPKAARDRRRRLEAEASQTA
jgi:Protein of unknown function (DUF3489)